MASKKKNTPKKTAAKKAAPKRRWYIGLFPNAATGEPVVAYTRKDGTPMPSVAKKVKGKHAVVHGVYKDVSFAQAHDLLIKAAKTVQAGKRLLEAKEAVETQ